MFLEKDEIGIGIIFNDIDPSLRVRLTRPSTIKEGYQVSAWHLDQNKGDWYISIGSDFEYLCPETATETEAILKALDFTQRFAREKSNYWQKINVVCMQTDRKIAIVNQR